MSRKRPRRRRRISLKWDYDVRKGIYILPNLITTASLFAGFFSIVSTINGQYDRAAWAILASILFDGADGRIARATRTASRFGIEYDSLADLVSFGVAPGLLVYKWSLMPFGRWGWAAAFLYMACGALRLARFNVQVETIEKSTFNGLPVPAAAGLIAVTVQLFYSLGTTGETAKHISILIVIFVLALLMVSNVKFTSFKDLEFPRRKPFIMLVGIILLLLVIMAEPQITLFILILSYVLSGPVMLLVRRVSRKSRPIEEPERPEESPLKEEGG